MVIFENGIKGLSDTKWSGVRGSAYRLVGIDFRSEPGAIKAHQKLSKISASVVDELCKVALPLSDGSTLWFSSESGKIWREVSDSFSLLGTLTIPGYSFRISTAEDTGNSYDYSAETTLPTAQVLKPDGTKMYVMGNGTTSGNGGEIFQYTLSTPFDVSTASYDTKTFAADLQAIGMFLSSDGTRLYVSEDNGSTTVISYTLSTPWDISTAVADSKTYDFSAQTNRGYAISLDPTLTKMYIWSGDNFNVHEYTLSTPGDVTTASFVQTLTTGATTINYGGYMTPDGTKLFMQNAGVINQWDMSTAWDLSTATTTFNYTVTDTSRRFALGFAPDGSGFYISRQSAPATVYQYSLTSVVADANVTVLGAEEYAVPDGGPDQDQMTQYVYFATKNWLFRIAVASITSIASGYDYLTLFKNGDDTYHPMKIANNRLFCADKYTILQVEESGVITLETNLSVREPERITTLANFDVDLLVGTKRLDEKSRILRWDTESETWYGEDVIYEGEIHAFLDEDNYTYAIVGDFGHMHYYDGEKLLKYMRIPGSYSSSAKCKVNQNATGYFMGVPIFGLSNITGNPNLQGIYSYGQYSKDYPIDMDLSFPISSDEFSGVEIGAIVVQGTDVYAAWKSGTGVGVDKLDWTTKYYGAYIETMVLNNAKDRSKFKAFDAALADYIEMPASTSLTMQYSKNYASYVTMDQVTDIKLLQLRSKDTIPEIGAIQLKFIFNTNVNDTPKIENFHGNFQGED